MNPTDRAEQLAFEHNQIWHTVNAEHYFDFDWTDRQTDTETMRRLLLAHPEMISPSLPEESEMRKMIQRQTNGIVEAYSPIVTQLIEGFHSLLSPSDPRPESGETKL